MQNRDAQRSQTRLKICRFFKAFLRFEPLQNRWSWVQVLLPLPEKSTCLRKCFFQLNPPLAEEIQLQWMKSLGDEICLAAGYGGGFNFIWSRRLKISSDPRSDFIVATPRFHSSSPYRTKTTDRFRKNLFSASIIYFWLIDKCYSKCYYINNNSKMRWTKWLS